MKYLVMVNQKYLVTVEANTNGGAEHKILDNVYYGIETCQAFSPEEMKTEFFRSCFEHCETISYSELYDKAAAYKKISQEIAEEKTKKEEYQKQIENLKEAIKLAESNRNACFLNLNTLSHNLATVF